MARAGVEKAIAATHALSALLPARRSAARDVARCGRPVRRVSALCRFDFKRPGGYREIVGGRLSRRFAARIADRAGRSVAPARDVRRVAPALDKYAQERVLGDVSKRPACRPATAAWSRSLP